MSSMGLLEKAQQKEESTTSDEVDLYLNKRKKRRQLEHQQRTAKKDEDMQSPIEIYRIISPISSEKTIEQQRILLEKARAKKDAIRRGHHPNNRKESEKHPQALSSNSKIKKSKSSKNKQGSDGKNKEQNASSTTIPIMNSNSKLSNHH